MRGTGFRVGQLREAQIAPYLSAEGHILPGKGPRGAFPGL